MAVQIATIRDTQSAEYLKSLALGEDDVAVALTLWKAARTLDPTSTTLMSHEALALYQLGHHDEVVQLASEVFPEHPRLVHLVNLFAASLCQLEYLKPAGDLLEYLLTMDPEYLRARSSLADIRKNLRLSKQAPERIRQAVREGLRKGRSMERPTLAVCMIVKDEQEFIEGAIGSVVDVADEIIVIDTGSQDETVALAQAAGAQVGYFEWTGDFSAARNASLGLATSSWILVLDADERLGADSRTTLRAVLEEYERDDDLRVICVKIRNYTRDGRFLSDGFSGRLFRNHPEMKFEGRIHEEVARDRSDVATDYRLDIAFDHFGADPEVMKEKAKDSRNLELLEARIRQVPDDLLTWFYLASQHFTGGRLEEAATAFENVLKYYRRDPSRYGMAIRNVPVAYSYVGLLRCLNRLGRLREGMSTAYAAIESFPENPDVLFHAGVVQMTQNELDAARDCFERAANIRMSGYGLISMNDPSIREWRAWKMVADIDFIQGEKVLAYQAYQDLIDRFPEDFDEWNVVYARLVELASSLKDWAQLPKWSFEYVATRPTEHAVAFQVATQLSRAGEGVMASVLMERIMKELPETNAEMEMSAFLGQLAEEGGNDMSALKWYEKAAQLGNSDPHFWLNLANLFVRNRNSEAAQEAFEVARKFAARQNDTTA